MAGSFEDSSIQVWNVYPKINTIDSSIEGMFAVFMAHRHANVKFVLWSKQSLNAQLTGCVCYFWAYNSVQVAIIIILCSFQNFFYTELSCFHSQQYPSLSSSLLLLYCTILHICNPEIIEASTILKKQYNWGNYSDDVYQCLNTVISYWKYSILILTPCNRFRINE